MKSDASILDRRITLLLVADRVLGEQSHIHSVVMNVFS